MAESRKNGPQGSEITISAWLDQIGATKEFVGHDGPGPPDFVIQYRGHTIAVESTLLYDPRGWGMTKERAFEESLRRLIDDVSREGANMPRWHATCEYDPRVPRPPQKSDDEWKGRVRDALRNPVGGELQLLPNSSIRGRGVVLELIPARNRGSFAGVSVDEGCMVSETLCDQLVAIVTEKADKVKKGKRSGKYTQWWLVVDDEVLVVPIRTLTGNERTEIDTSVRNSPGIPTWSKVVMVSRFGTEPGRVHEYSFYAPWEDPRHPPLSTSPR